MSWLSLGEVEPTAEVAAVFAATRAKLGYVRVAQRLMANVPPVMVAQDGLSRSLMAGGETSLTAREREFLALIVSVENGCTACVFGHASRLRLETGDAFWVGTVEANYRHAQLTARERAMGDYAIKLTRTPAEMGPADLEPLRQAGLSETDIIYTAGIVAFFNLSNRINSGLGVVPNREAHEAGRG